MKPIPSPRNILVPGLFSVLAVVAGLFLMVGCRKKASDEIDFGVIHNSVFSNHYFGMTVVLPSDWSVQDQEAQRRLTQLGSKLLAGDDKNMKAIIKASEMQVVNLFAVFKHPVGTPVDFNPNALALCEVVRHLPGIQRGKDYHFQTRKTLEGGQLRVTFPREIYPVKLGGVEFDVMDVEIPTPQIKVRQKYFSTITKGYALSFIVSYATPEQEAALQKILDTVAFK